MRRRKRRRKKRQNQTAWFCTGIMLLILTGIMLFHDGGIKKGGGNDLTAVKKYPDTASLEAKRDKAEKTPVCLENLDDIEAGTVLETDRIDLSHASDYFTVNEINDDVLQCINGKSYVENEHIQLDELRYLKLLHYNYSHKIQVGELIVNEKIAKDCREIFQELFSQQYEIASMCLIDKFWTGDSVDSDTNSIENNNTSAFNYRVVPDTDRLSNHAAGFAIDVNPLQNPYVKYNNDGSFAKYYKDMEKYTDRKQKEKHMITHDDICYQIFAKHGFTWGGDWNNSKDYQHFEKKSE